MTEELANNVIMTLSVDALAAATTLTVTSTAGVPVGVNLRAQCGTELMQVAYASGTTLTAVRGVEGTTAALHVSGTQLALVVTKAGMAQFVIDHAPAAPVTSVAGHTGVVTLVESDIGSLVGDLAAKAALGAVNTFTHGQIVSMLAGESLTVKNHLGTVIFQVNEAGNVATTNSTLDISGTGNMSVGKNFSLSGILSLSNNVQILDGLGAPSSGATSLGGYSAASFAVNDVYYRHDAPDHDHWLYRCITAGSSSTSAWEAITLTPGATSFGTPAIVLGTAAAAGSASTAVRTDATIVAFDATAPTASAPGDAAAVGSVALGARRDHKHGRESYGLVGDIAVVGNANAAGAAGKVADAAHVHAGVRSIVAGTNITTSNDGAGNITVNSSAGGASPLTTKGDLYGFSTVAARIPVGTDTQVLTADSTQALGVKWAAAAAAPAATHRARAHQSANQTLSAGQNNVTLDVVDFDPNSNFASNQYTVPVTGTYLITASVSVNSNSRIFAGIYKTTTELARGTDNASSTTSQNTSVVSTIEALTAGDVIHLQIYSVNASTTASGYPTVYFSVARLA